MSHWLQRRSRDGPGGHERRRPTPSWPTLTVDLLLLIVLVHELKRLLG
jgi:hypothetical protein